MKKVFAILLAALLAVLPVLGFAADGSWSCPECSTENTGNFCSNCGTAKPAEAQTVKFCPNCGHDLQGQTVKFCPNCGAALTAVEAGPTPLPVAFSGDILENLGNALSGLDITGRQLILEAAMQGTAYSVGLSAADSVFSAEAAMNGERILLVQVTGDAVTADMGGSTVIGMKLADLQGLLSGKLPDLAAVQADLTLIAERLSSISFNIEDTLEITENDDGSAHVKLNSDAYADGIIGVIDSVLADGELTAVLDKYLPAFGSSAAQLKTRWQGIRSVYDKTLRAMKLEGDIIPRDDGGFGADFDVDVGDFHGRYVMTGTADGLVDLTFTGANADGSQSAEVTMTVDDKGFEMTEKVAEDGEAVDVKISAGEDGFLFSVAENGEEELYAAYTAADGLTIRADDSRFRVYPKSRTADALVLGIDVTDEGSVTELELAVTLGTAADEIANAVLRTADGGAEILTLSLKTAGIPAYDKLENGDSVMWLTPDALLSMFEDSAD